MKIHLCDYCSTEVGADDYDTFGRTRVYICRSMKCYTQAQRDAREEYQAEREFAMREAEERFESGWSW